MGAAAVLQAYRDEFFVECVEGMTARQKRVAFSRAQFVACHPGRRAGKSWAIPRMAVWACTRAPGGDIVLGAETLKKAKALYWWPLMELVKGRPGWSYHAQEGWIRSPWGPVIRLWGLKDNGAVALLRGFSILEAHFDEVASYAQRLHMLVNDVIEPMLGEWRHYPGGGRCFLWGTPSYTRQGAWFEICDGDEQGEWEVHHWDVRDNEHYPDPVGYLANVRKRHKWDETNATYRREYLGLFVDDSERLCFRYSSDVLVDRLPDTFDPKLWQFTLAVDFGLRHETAWCLLGNDPRERAPITYMVKTHAAAGLLLDDASAITAEWVRKFNVVQLIGDAHGLGAPYVEAWNRLKLAPIVMKPAEKKDKRGWIDIFNDALSTQELLVYGPDCASWVDEVSSLPWDEKRLEPDPNHPNDSAMAGLYAFRHHRDGIHIQRKPPASRVSQQERIERRLDREALNAKRQKWYDR